MKLYGRKLFQETPTVDPIEDNEEVIDDVDDLIDSKAPLKDPDSKSLFKRRINFKDKNYA